MSKTSPELLAPEVVTGAKKVGLAVAATFLPGIGALAEAVQATAEVSRARRLNMLFAVAIDCDAGGNPSDPRVTKAVEEFTTSSEDVLAIFRRAISEDDEEKVWLLGAMLRAFALGEVPLKDERMRMLRFASIVVGDDLHSLASIATAALGVAEKGNTLGNPLGISHDHSLGAAFELSGLRQRSGHKDERGLVVPDKDTPLFRLFRIADCARRSKETLAPLFRL